MSKSKFDPKDFFLWLMAMVALYVSVVSMLVLLFQYVNVLFPDPLDTRYIYDPYSGAIRFAIAALVVFFPVYVWLTRILNQTTRKHHEKAELGIRKWLIYLALFISGLSIIIDLVVLVNTFLGGEITIRFVMKVLAVFVVFGAVFGYYLYDLKGKWQKEQKKSVAIGWIAVILVFGTILSGFFIIGSPQAAREIKLDQERVNDLQNIQRQVLSYWQQQDELPETLAELEDPLGGKWGIPTDPQTGDTYEYTVTGDLSFKLCATFLRQSRDISPSLKPVGTAFENDNWQHETGETCFERTIDPERHSLPERVSSEPVMVR